MLNRFFKETKDNPYTIYLIVLAVCLFAVYFLGFFNPVRGDAVRYAAIGQEMLNNNNFLELQNRGGVPYMQKPPILFWIISSSFRIFGISHFAYKMPIFLIAMVGIFTMYRNARLNYDIKVASIAVLFMATSFGMIFYQNDIHTDTILLTTMLLSIYQLNLFLRNQKFIHLVLGFFFIGLSMMTKGPIGLAIPVFAFGVDTLLKRNWKVIFKWEWLVGIIIIAITISPAIIGLYRQFGMEGVEFYFVSNNTGRITGSLRANNTDYLYYLHTLLWEFIPWSLFIVYGLFRELNQVVSNRFKLDTTKEALNIGGIIIFFIIISISRFKGPNYLIPLFPFFAVLGAKWTVKLYDELSQKTINWISIFQYFISSLLWIIALIVTFLNIADIPIYVIGLLLILFCTAISTVYLLKNQVAKVVVNSSIAIIAVGLIFNAFIVPLTFQYHSMLQSSIIVNKHSNEDTKFVMLQSGDRVPDEDTFNFYMNPDPIYTNKVADVMDMKSGWVFVKPHDFDTLEEKGKKFKKVRKMPHLKGSLLPLLYPKTRSKALKYNYLLEL